MTDTDKELIEIVANLIVMTTVGRQAHPEAKEILEAMQDSTIAILAVTKGPDWIKTHDEAIGQILRGRLDDLKEQMQNVKKAN